MSRPALAGILLLSPACGTDSLTAAILEAPESFPEAPAQGEDDRVLALYERVVEATPSPIPFDNSVRDSETHSLKRLVYTPGEEVYREQLCATWGNEVFGTIWTFAANFPTRRGIVERPLRPLGDRFVAGPYIDLLGTDVEAGPLPEALDDPGLVDTDGDGVPGVTIYIDNDIMGGGQVYVAQRSTTTLRGDWIDETTATGPIDTETQSNTLDASTAWLRLQGPGNEPLPEKSFFVVMRIDPTLDCAAIDEQADGWGLTVRP